MSCVSLICVAASAALEMVPAKNVRRARSRAFNSTQDALFQSSNFLFSKARTHFFLLSYSTRSISECLDTQISAC